MSAPCFAPVWLRQMLKYLGSYAAMCSGSLLAVKGLRPGEQSGGLRASVWGEYPRPGVSIRSKCMLLLAGLYSVFQGCLWASRSIRRPCTEPSACRISEK